MDPTISRPIIHQRSPQSFVMRRTRVGGDDACGATDRRREREGGSAARNPPGTQNENFAPICNSRIGERELLMRPYVALDMFVSGSPQIGWLNALNASSRNCTLRPPPKNTFRMSDRSVEKI